MNPVPFSCIAGLAGAVAVQAATPIIVESTLVRYNVPAGNEFAANFTGQGLVAGPLSPGSSAAILEPGIALPGSIFLHPTLASPDLAAARLNEQFFEFSLSSSSGLGFAPQTLSFAAGRGGSSGPRGWALFTSLDGFTSPLAQSDVTPQQPALEDFTVGLGSIPLSAEEIVFRLYGYSPDEGDGLFFDEINLEGLLEILQQARFRPELLLAAGSASVHGGRQFHREVERRALGRTIGADDCFQAWGSTGTDWFGGGAGETSLTQGGLSFKLPHGMIGQVAGSLESTRGAPIDADTLRLGFAVDNGTARGLQWLGYLGAFGSQFESSSSGSLRLGSGPTAIDTSGIGLQTLGTVAWWFQHGPVTWAPFAGAEYLRLAVEGADFAGSATPGHVALDDLDSLRSYLGVRAHGVPLFRGIQPFGSIALATEWSSADGGTLMTSTGTFPVQDPNGRGTSLTLSGGVGFPIAGPVHATASYTGELPLSGNGVESHGLRFGVHASF